jgi:MFS family permease
MAMTAASIRSPLMRLLLLGATILTLCTGLRQSLGLFLLPMKAELGVSASAFGFAMAVQAIVWGLGQPLIGMLADRWGTRPVVGVAALFYVSGLLLMGWPGGTLGLDLGGVLIGLGIAGTGLGVVLGPVSRAVPPERRSQTIGTVAAAGSLGTFLLAPIGQWLIDGAGWRSALLVFAGVAGGWPSSGWAFGRCHRAPGQPSRRGRTSRRSATFCGRRPGIPAISP